MYERLKAKEAKWLQGEIKIEEDEIENNKRAPKLGRDLASILDWGEGGKQTGKLIAVYIFQFVSK